MGNDASYNTLPGLFQFFRWDFDSHKWGFIEDSINHQSHFFHHTCLDVELDSPNRLRYHVYRLGVSPKTKKICCSRISDLDDATIREIMAHYDEYSDDYKTFIDNFIRCYFDYVSAFPIDDIPSIVKQQADSLVEHLKRISRGILYSCFEVTFSQGTVYRRDPDDRWFSQHFWSSIADDSYDKVNGMTDSYVYHLIHSKEIDEYGNLLPEDIYKTQRDYYNKWRQEIVDEYDVTKHVDSLIEDAIKAAENRHSSHLKPCCYHCCSDLVNHYKANYIQSFSKEFLKYKEDLAQAAKLSSNSFDYHGFVFCVNSDQKSVTLQTTTGALGNCTTYLKPESDDNSVEFRIPESIIANGKRYPVTIVARGVFDSMKKLRTIVVPRFVEVIKWSFWDCDQLENIQVDPHNTHFCDIDGVLFSFDKQTLIAFPQNKGEEYDIPDGVKRIENLAFKNNKNIQKLFIPDSLSSIGFNAFYRCEHLREIHGNKFHKIKFEGMFGKAGDVNPRVIFDKDDNDARRTLQSMLVFPYEKDTFEIYP